MKRYIIGFLVGAAIMLPVGGFAWSSNQEATPVKAYDCAHSLDDGGQRQPYNCVGVVNRFDDRDNTCYVTTNKGAISCVKK